MIGRGALRYLLLVLVLLATSAVIGSGAVNCQSSQGSNGGVVSSCSGGAGGPQSGSGGKAVQLAADPSSTQFTTSSPSVSTTPSSSTTQGSGSGSGVPLSGALVLSLVAISAGIVFYAGARIFGRKVQEPKPTS